MADTTENSGGGGGRGCTRSASCSSRRHGSSSACLWWCLVDELGRRGSDDLQASLLPRSARQAPPPSRLSFQPNSSLRLHLFFLSLSLSLCLSLSLLLALRCLADARRQFLPQRIRKAPSSHKTKTFPNFAREMLPKASTPAGPGRSGESKRAIAGRRRCGPCGDGVPQTPGPGIRSCWSAGAAQESATGAPGRPTCPRDVVVVVVVVVVVQIGKVFFKASSSSRIPPQAVSYGSLAVLMATGGGSRPTTGTCGRSTSRR